MVESGPQLLDYTMGNGGQFYKHQKREKKLPTRTLETARQVTFRI